jgi:CheY-like chemotaxis protein
VVVAQVKDMQGFSTDRAVRHETANFESRRRRVMNLLEDRARRTELVAAVTGASGVDADRAASALCAELNELEISAAEAGLQGLAAMAHTARKAVSYLGGVAVAKWEPREVIVLDHDEATRDLVTIALQAEGHRVRSAANVAEASWLVCEKKPHVLLCEARLPDAPAVSFCNYLRREMALDRIPIVIFSSACADELVAFAREAGAEFYLSKDQGIGDLMGGVARLFESIYIYE